VATVTLPVPGQSSGHDVEEEVVLALEQLAFASVGITERAVAAAVSVAEVSLPQWRVLTLLFRAAGPLRLADVGSQAGLSAPSASRMMARLAGRGLITASIDRGDRRVLRIRLSRRGREFVRAILATRREAFRAALAGLTLAPTFGADLRGVASALDDAEADSQVVLGRLRNSGVT
jgi:DNA-binding MarR family transcriptional regulator